MWDFFETLLSEVRSLIADGYSTFAATQFGDRAFIAVMLVTSIAVSAFLVRRRRRTRQIPDTDAINLFQMTRGARLVGYVAAIFLVIGLGGWSVVAQLASAAIAPGVVSPDGSRKTIQHLEGGIIRTIHIAEGDTVTAGQTLISLEDVKARAVHDELQKRHIYLMATEARLLAEQTGAEDLTPPEELAALRDEAVQPAITAQRDLLASRLATQSGRERILDQRIKQLQEQNRGLFEMIAGFELQATLVAEEIASVEELLDQGLERRPRLLELKRGEASIAIQRAEARADIARNLQQIGETEIQLLTLREQSAEKASEQLADVRRVLAELRSELAYSRDVLTRTDITAPIAGTVMNLRVTTRSGVVTPGQPLLEIVPNEAPLIIDAKVKPVDIDSVHAGLRARVVLTAYRQRNLPQLYGLLRSVSADVLREEQSGEPYFLAKVQVDPNEIAELGDIRLSPGMPAEVMILTGQLTPADYVLGPFFDSLRRSFRG